MASITVPQGLLLERVLTIEIVRVTERAAVNAARLLEQLGYDRHTCDLASVAALLHDIGNLAGRANHASVGAFLAYQLLVERGVAVGDAADVMAAVANHDETEGGVPVNAISAALIIADKADIHRSRVRTPDSADYDIHDRVNHAVTKADLRFDPEKRLIALDLQVDTSDVSPEQVADLFANRFDLSRAAARFLGCEYVVEANGKPIR